jgi:chorismate mutase/prephenate dehydratase
MSQTQTHVTSLETLRQRIDELDARMHETLMERARVIEGITAAKRASGGSEVVLRPDREAELMRKLVERHEGSLPLYSVEHVWREIISACTGLQKPFVVHMDGSADLAEMLDTARFYFGFTVDLEPGGDAADVVGAVAASKHDLGIIALEDRSELPWWRGLNENSAQIVGRLPFLVMEDRPADAPALVISPAIPGGFHADTVVFDARWSGVLPGNLMSTGLEVISFHRSASGVDALLAAPAEMNEAAVLASCAEAGAEPDVLRRVGGYPAPIDTDGDPDEDFASDEPAVSEG